MTRSEPTHSCFGRLWALAMVTLALMAQGCREDEQDRPLVHDKGNYQGPVDQKLDQDQLEALRQRTNQQRM